MEPVLNTRVAVLHLLRQGEAHAPELVRRARKLTEGQLRLTPPRVHAALQDLAARRLIEGRRVSPGGARGARSRIVYTLTAAGRARVAEERMVFASIVDGTPPPPDAGERKRMAERLLEADELSRSGRELRDAMARARR